MKPAVVGSDYSIIARVLNVSYASASAWLSLTTVVDQWRERMKDWFSNPKVPR